MRLVIVESPNKVKKIGGFLGSGFKVAASFGHIRDLPSKGGIGLELRPDTVIGDYQVQPAKTQQVKSLRALAKAADEILIATDPDREGEAIGWHLMEVLGKKKIYKRVVFNSITAAAVRDAVANPKTLDMHLVDAQQARRFLDRVVGWLVSPTLRNGVGPTARSAGRVQSVAVRIVAERESAIQCFTPVSYCDLIATLEASSEPIFKARLTKRQKQDVGHSLNAADAETICSEAQQGTWSVSKVTKKQSKRQPPPPFTTSTVQQAASVSLRMNPEITMNGLQKLFEEGLITYHRTDSTSLSPEGISLARQVIEQRFGPTLLPPSPILHASKLANAQEAHEAIRPTHPESGPDDSDIDGALRPLYALIWNRFVSSQMVPGVDDVTVIEVGVSTLPDCDFEARGRVVVVPGWRIVGDDTTQEKEGQDDDDNAPLPAVTQGESLDLIDLAVAQKKTKPPARFTQASLIKELERQGVGRPSTYASIMKTIMDREYVGENKRKLFATNLGLSVTEWLIEHYRNNFIEVAYTSSIEEALDEIAAGKRPWSTFLLQEIQSVLKLSKQAGLSYDPFSAQPIAAVKVVEGVQCPLCKSGMREINGPKGLFYGCVNYPQCKGTLNPGQENKPPPKQGPACPLCGSHTIERHGKFGTFFGCSQYPKCKGIVRLEQSNSSKTPNKNGSNPTAAQSPKCPLCHGGMRLVPERPGKWKAFWGCLDHPNCKGTLPHEA